MEEIINQHSEISSSEERTVGYGDRFPKYDGPGLVVKNNNDALGIEHEIRHYKHGFDLTTFGEGSDGAKLFIEILQQAGLDPVDDYVRVYRDAGRNTKTEYEDRFINVWVNKDIMIATTNNPITGEGFTKNHTTNGQGYAGYIGVQGILEIGEDTANKIINSAESIKDHKEGTIFF